MFKKLFFMTVALLPVFAVNAQQVSGTVVASDTNTPIAGALVTLHGGSEQVITAADGTFSMNLTGTNLRLVGASKGFYYQSTITNSPATGVLLALDPVPSTDNPGYQLLSPNDCGSCHPKQLNDWLGSPMARAGFNSWVNDIYAGNGTAGGQGGFVYTRDSVFAHSNPNSECASCHQPQSWIDNPFTAIDANTTTPTPSVQHGVSCDVCHKVADVDTSKINFPGIFPGAVQFSRPNFGNQVMYGVLGDVDYNLPTLMRASYQPQMRAELCATCHQDAADPDENHSYTGVISEPTYLEWLASDYANPQSPAYADCVSCHMKPSSDNQVCSMIAAPNRPVASVRDHRIEGTTPEFLENAVAMDLHVSANDTQLQVNVTINNNQTGHHVPTGVTIRNMILLVEAWEQGQDPLVNPLVQINNQVIHDLGGVGDPAQGYFAGLPGKFFAKVNHDANGNGPTFFTDATGILFDNRIPANHSDSSTYIFALPNHQGEFHVRARLIYRKAFRFIVDAKGWTEDGHGQPLADVMAPDFGHLMEIEERVIRGGINSIPAYSKLSLFILTIFICMISLLWFKRKT
ncbi:MAG: hypothetical protein DWP95_07075 [Proteobacteria bacterium]|nr:MAG: hypothetical protein DWP95_07075 [Pseudomonadota bacterium]